MKNLRILLVDDESVSEMNAGKDLHDIGYDVLTTVLSGNKVIQRADEWSPDLIIINVSLPCKIESIDLIKQIEEKLDMPVMLLSKRAGDSGPNQTETTNSNRYIVNLIRMTDLNLAIESVLYDRKKEERMNEIEEKYSDLFDRSLEGIFLLDLEGNFIDGNNTILEMTGYSKSDIKTLDITSLISKEQLPEALNIMQEIIETGTQKELKEYKIRKKKGEYIWVEVKGSLIYKHGAPYAIQGIVHDITRRKHIEEALQESEAKYRILFESAADAIVLANDRVFIDCNKKTLEIFGCSRDEIIDHSPVEFSPPVQPDGRKSDEKAREKIRAAMDEGPQVFEWMHKKHDGTLFDAEVSLNKVELSAGNYILANIRDITDRKGAEKELNYRANFERMITEISNDFINLSENEIDNGIDKALRIIGEFSGVDRSYVFQFSNAFKEISNTHEWCNKGISSQKDRVQNIPIEYLPWIAQKLLKLEVIHVPRVDDLPEEAQSEKEEAKEQGIKSVVGVPLVTGGRCIGGLGFDAVREEREWSEENIITLKLAAHAIANALERKRTDEEIKASLQEKETLLKEIHHRVKNNFQLIISLLNLQESTIENQEYSKIIGESRNRIKAMSMIHESLYQTENLAFIDIDDYIKTITTELYRTYLCDPEKIELDIRTKKVPIGINKAIPCGLIINELVSNSIKHAFPDGWNKKGKITVSLREKNNIVWLTVKDNGIGIPEDIDLEKINTLGLVLLPALVRQIKGEYDINREKGTSFTISFKI